ncbi:MAG: sugar transferase [Bacteroidales bacterium]|nr:sugar transferase [Bacteroidales bacterium]MDY6347429.1 sugar transferase [Bacteroidales bacterium]
MKRLFDIAVSLVVLVIGFPFALIVAAIIVADSPGGVFYVQNRVGRGNTDFRLLKFRTMRTDADKSGLLTVGGRDPRITRVGRFLRKYKIDELPQFLNILAGDMSVVGPRPEVRKYVDMYSPEQMKVLSVRPGLTDYASIKYVDENEILAKSDDPEQTYINVIMPDKLRLNIEYIERMSMKEDLRIIFMTISAVFRK